MSPHLVRSFPPLATPEAHTLVLGTMPGTRSLAAGQYYAHPRNAFWPIMATVLSFAVEATYAERVRRLTSAGVAVWDVLNACRREGSLDTAIEPDTAVANDLPSFLEAHPAIRRILFNGGNAERLFRRHVDRRAVAPTMPAQLRLPSTSPANARTSYGAKLGAWRQALAA